MQIKKYLLKALFLERLNNHMYGLLIFLLVDIYLLIFLACAEINKGPPSFSAIPKRRSILLFCISGLNKLFLHWPRL